MSEYHELDREKFAIFALLATFVLKIFNFVKTLSEVLCFV
jgi:hypothetical protein